MNARGSAADGIIESLPAHWLSASASFGGSGDLASKQVEDQPNRLPERPAALCANPVVLLVQVGEDWSDD
jgi:hypothetical protein